MILAALASVVNAKKKTMDNFDARKWFKNQYLEEGMSDEEIHAIKRYEELSNDDKLKLAKIQAMMDRERSLREDDLEEIRYPQDNFTQFQLVPRMEGIVNSETYRKFTDSLDSLLDDWYRDGFEKDDVLAFMKVIIPSS